MKNEQIMIEALKNDLEFNKRVIDQLKKELQLLKHSITSFSKNDLDFIYKFNQENTDKSLHDFFNKILYRYARPDHNGISKTVIGRC